MQTYPRQKPSKDLSAVIEELHRIRDVHGDEMRAQFECLRKAHAEVNDIVLGLIEKNSEQRLLIAQLDARIIEIERERKT